MVFKLSHNVHSEDGKIVASCVCWDLVQVVYKTYTLIYIHSSVLIFALHFLHNFSVVHFFLLVEHIF